MATVVVLVCALAIAGPDCQRATAKDVLIAPEKAASDLACMRLGLMYAAESGAVVPGYYAKVRCERQTAGKVVG